MVAFVDDDPDDLELLQDTLDRSGYSGPSVQLRNGQELMDYLHSSGPKPSVITLDLNMPLKNGFQALEEIKLHAQLKNIPVIILSASSSGNDEKKCRQLGCEMFIRKPDSIQGYKAVIANLLEMIFKG